MSPLVGLSELRECYKAVTYLDTEYKYIVYIHSYI